MSNTKQILKDAIADAKAVRETALAQAKLALEEAFTPQLQSMLAAKLNEMEMDEEIDIKAAGQSGEDEQMEETLDLEALLAEDSVDEIEKEGSSEEAEKEGSSEETEKMGSSEEEEEKDITEMTPDEVEEYIRQIASEEFAKLETEQGEEVPGEEGEEINLDAELGPKNGEEEINIDEIIDESDLDEQKYGDEGEKEIDENDINIDELLAEFGLSEEEEVNELKTNFKVPQKSDPSQVYVLSGQVGYYRVKDGKFTFVGLKKSDLGINDDDIITLQPISENSDLEEELAQALATIDELRSSIQEVNLLNAKLLYMNKVFKGTNLTESQKINVVKTFDKAESAKEAKLVYESMITSFTNKAEVKSNIKESVGFASKAVGMITNSNAKVIETDAQYNRWEKLAFGK